MPTRKYILDAVHEAVIETEDEFIAQDLVKSVQKNLGKRISPNKIACHLKMLFQMGMIEQRKIKSGDYKGRIGYTLSPYYIRMEIS